MKKIALTGGIASGKTTVGKYFTQQGEVVIDLDDIAKNILLECRDTLQTLFGKEIISHSGVNTQLIRERVFANSDLRNKLEAITHPKILTRMQEQINALNCDRVIVMVPLLYEKKLFVYFDEVLVMNCNREVQYERLVKRDNISSTLAQQMLDAQVNNEERLKVCEYLPCRIIENNMNLEKLKHTLSLITL